MIRVQDLTKEFDDARQGLFRAVDRVSFEVRPGEIYGLLGPNGAGKTTCLRILSTVLRPTRGLAEVDGINVVRDPEGVRRRIGFMSCNTGIYDRMTAREMVEYYGRLYGIPEVRLQARIDELFDVLQMQDIRDRLCGKMSTGMKQKVSIARTIVHDPPVIIFDEPTSGLDVLVARAVLKTVAALRDQGKCIIFSTHIMREVEKLCDRIAVIHRGRILAEGTLPELTSRFGQPDVEELFFELVRRRDEEVLNSQTVPA
jgi:sodium transport system ATP-binding protein